MSITATGTRMSDDDVVTILTGNSVLNRARQEFSSACARIEQAGAQRQPLSPIEKRRMEIEAVQSIAAIVGVRLE